MYIEKCLLNELSNQYNCPLSEIGGALTGSNLHGKPSVEYNNEKKWSFLPMILIPVSVISVDGSLTHTLFSQHATLAQEELIISEKQLEYTSYSYTSKYLYNIPLSPHEKIFQIKKLMGFNILELAAILQVSRPTIYDWIESKEKPIRKNHQERLDCVYEICSTWGDKHLGLPGNYLYKKIGPHHLSLLDLLKEDILNQKEIAQYFESITKFILTQRQKEADHMALLQQHGFEPVSREDRDDRLNDIDFLD